MEGKTGSSRAASFFNQGTTGLRFYNRHAKSEPSEVISTVANGRRSRLSADWPSHGSAGVKHPV